MREDIAAGTGDPYEPGALGFVDRGEHRRLIDTGRARDDVSAEPHTDDGCHAEQIARVARHEIEAAGEGREHALGNG